MPDMEPEGNVELPGLYMEGQDPPNKLLIWMIPTSPKIQVYLHRRLQLSQMDLLKFQHWSPKVHTCPQELYTNQTLTPLS